MSKREDDFDLLWNSTPAATTGGDDFDALWESAPAAAAEPEPPSMLERLKDAFRPSTQAAAFKTLLQGPTLGAGSAVRAGIRALPSALPGGKKFGEAYDEALASENADINRIRGEAPVLSAVGEAVASLPVSGGAGAVRALTGRAASALPKALPGVGRMLGEGAAVGGTYAFNEAEGGLGEKAVAGLAGAGIGGAAGGLLTGAAQPLSRPFVGATSRGVVGGGVGAVAPAEDGGERLKNALLGAGVGVAAPYAVRGALNMNRTGAVGDVGAVAGAAGRSAPEFKEPALVKVLRAFRDDQPHTDLGLYAASAADEVKPTAILDQGENLRGLARAARTVGGRAKQEIPEVLGQRGAAQEERILKDLLETTGLKQRSDVVETIDDSIRRRAEDASPLYEAAHNNPAAQNIEDPVINELLQRPSMKRALSRAQELAAEEGAPLAEGAMSLRTLDYIKRGLDEELFLGKQARATGQGGLGPGMERAALANRAKLLERLDEIVPEYGQARAASAGPAAERRAFETGLDLFKMHPSEAKKVLADMGEAEREAFRRGAMESVGQQVEGTSTRFDLAKRRPLDDRTLDRQRLRLVFDDDAGYDRFLGMLGDEVRMARSHSEVTGGSNTADKLMEVGRLFDIPLEDIATGNKEGLVRGMLKFGGDRLRAGYTTGAADDLVDPLLAGARGDRDKYADLVKALRDLEERRVGRDRLLNPSRKATGVGAGSLVGDQFR